MIPDRLQQFIEPVSVLDKGFIQLMDVMGDDAAICEAARVSVGAEGGHVWREAGNLDSSLFGHETLYQCLLCDRISSHKEDGPCAGADCRTIRRMLGGDPRHTTPFEQAIVKLRVKLPIFVERQWVRHRTASHVERSGRRTPHLEVYRPPENRPGIVDCEEEPAGSFCMEFEQNQLKGVQLADEYAKDTPRELARVQTSIGVYTIKVWTMDVKNLLDLLYLRLDGHAQWEIRQYALAMTELIKTWCPLTWEAFIDFRFCSVRFSRQEMGELMNVIGDSSGDLSPGIVAKLGKHRRRVAEWASSFPQK